MASKNPLPCLIFPLSVLIIFHFCDKCGADGEEMLSLGASIGTNQAIISKNGTFQLGFFSPNGNSDNWYIGIWYAKLAEKTIIWVANRERPAKKMPGVLNLSTRGSLGLFDEEGASLWSAKISNKASRAVILDSGNFVVLIGDNNKLSDISWQSFDHPTDTWLPGMKIGGERKLVCWKNSWDPASGHYSFQQDPSATKQIWSGDHLINMRNSPSQSNSNVFIRVAASALPSLSVERKTTNLKGIFGLFLQGVEDRNEEVLAIRGPKCTPPLSASHGHGMMAWEIPSVFHYQTLRQFLFASGRRIKLQLKPA